MSWRWPARTCPAGWSPGWPGWRRTCPPSSAPSAGTAACSPELHSPSWLHKHKHTTQSLKHWIFKFRSMHSVNTQTRMSQHFTYYSCSAPADWQINSLGDDAAEERHIKPELLRQRVEATHGSEVNQAVSGLLAVLDRNSSCGDQDRRALQQTRRTYKAAVTVKLWYEELNLLCWSERGWRVSWARCRTLWAQANRKRPGFYSEHPEAPDLHRKKRYQRHLV